MVYLVGDLNIGNDAIFSGLTKLVHFSNNAFFLQKIRKADKIYLDTDLGIASTSVYSGSNILFQFTNNELNFHTTLNINAIFSGSDRH